MKKIPPSPCFQSSFVQDSDHEILCDVLWQGPSARALSDTLDPEKTGTAKVKFWVHADCFPTLAFQEGVPMTAVSLLCDTIDLITDTKVKGILESCLLALTDCLGESACDEL